MNISICCWGFQVLEYGAETKILSGSRTEPWGTPKTHNEYLLDRGPPRVLTAEGIIHRCFASCNGLIYRYIFICLTPQKTVFVSFHFEYHMLETQQNYVASAPEHQGQGEKERTSQERVRGKREREG